MCLGALTNHKIIHHISSQPSDCDYPVPTWNNVVISGPKYLGKPRGWRLQHMAGTCLALLIACPLVPTLWQPHQGSNSLEAKLWWYCWWFVRNPARKPVEVGSLSHYLQGFIILYIPNHPRWCRISSTNSTLWVWFVWQYENDSPEFSPILQVHPPLAIVS